CEIGAGDPYVADLLARLGYHVTVVDPYEGLARGPTQFERFVRDFPRVRFVRDLFRSDTAGLEAASFDGVFSISVVEHVPEEETEAFVAAIAKFLKPGGRSIHAIDFVLKGIKADVHRRRLTRQLLAMGETAEEIERVLTLAADDVETYFLSALGHDSWRANQPYDSFPMRRVISVNVCR
ncbi:MAG: class I SAM-dependent methyltransferase, partial [Rhodospirillales bacterium]|nr:class I SAM-dependent methyltransferase [Rhodospirillales bacterium]